MITAKEAKLIANNINEQLWNDEYIQKIFNEKIEQIFNEIENVAKKGKYHLKISKSLYDDPIVLKYTKKLSYNQKVIINSKIEKQLQILGYRVNPILCDSFIIKW